MCFIALDIRFDITKQRERLRDDKSDSSVEGKEMVRETFGVFTNLGIELNFNQNSDNQKQALIEALYKLEGISTIEMKIT
jgi:hypothetical protein